MNDYTPSPMNSNDEVDIINFFEYLGNVFKKIGTGIKKIFLFLFQILLVIPFYYFKKHKRLTLGLIGFAFVAGLILDAFKMNLYKAEILVSPNFNSGKALYTRIDYFNNLIDEEQFGELAEELHIDSIMASAFKEFRVEPNFNERIFLRTFSEFQTLIDTTRIKPAYEEFKKSYTDQEFDYPQQKITAIAARPNVFYPLNKVFKNLFNGNTLFEEKRDTRLKTIREELKQVDKSIAELDSLRKAVNTALKSLAKQGSLPSGSVVVGGSSMEFPEVKYNVFDEKKSLLKKKEILNEALILNKDILILDSHFPPYGEKYHPFKKQLKFVLPLGIFVLFLISFYLIHLFVFLNRFVQQKFKKDQV